KSRQLTSAARIVVTIPPLFPYHPAAAPRLDSIATRIARSKSGDGTALHSRYEHRETWIERSGQANVSCPLRATLPRPRPPRPGIGRGAGREGVPLQELIGIH